MRVAAALARWRKAERHASALQADDPDRPDAIMACIDAWLDYQAVAEVIGPREIVLVTDADRRYVRATANAAAELGFDPVGQRIDDLVPTDEVPADELWPQFVAAGRMDGTYSLKVAQGKVVPIRYHAIADVPFPGFYASRIRLLAPTY